MSGERRWMSEAMHRMSGKVLARSVAETLAWADGPMGWLLRYPASIFYYLLRSLHNTLCYNDSHA